MPWIDTRSPISFDDINTHLLKVAHAPLDFTPEDTPGRMPGEHEFTAAKLAAQASAAIICNCAMEIWSNAVAGLHTLEPDFPFYPEKVSAFVRESRMPWLSYISIYYHMCEKPFVGTATYDRVKLIIDMRHEIEHDKPEENSEEWAKRRADEATKWFNRLAPHIGVEGLYWLPKVRRSGKIHPLGLGGQPVIMKFMKYPVAEWAMKSTSEVVLTLMRMLANYRGNKKFSENDDEPDDRFKPGNDVDLRRLWNAGE